MVAFITRSCFSKEVSQKEEMDVEYELPGMINKVSMIANMYCDSTNKYHVYIQKGLKALAHFCKVITTEQKTTLKFFKMPPSISIILEISYPKGTHELFKRMEPG